ncbi:MULTISPECIES: ABC transporter permease [Achromobacter]|uniref:Dipeptide transport system permease protein DppB n=2 Tax=Achromobacter piechaudii TaxID=72556 RepID=A0A6S7EV08_9BURK|nr:MULTISPECIES: ABC transporter permease [Achromobacter]EFF75932.1 ABC transporter, permease protein [Achromobacter piechaudii ATCC 43553]KNY10698.1 ABC transporter permease [Achromobacter piechaudii]MPS79213.1 ABC transporter permease [Achromobacter sp.]CAB3728003.1 Dipeptide transport system permease protein DppB [Achromobacter piechaudii]CAB3903563.1 Dipeptide transport system permease protein DppB [Achromobacter piechaudii]
MKFLSFFLSRIGKALVVVLGVVIINFFLIRLAPGDPAAVLAGQAGAGDAAYVDQLRVAFGLDKPILTQLMLYLKGVVQLDLGFSYRNHVPVLDLIVERLPATFLLMSCAFLFSIVLGVFLGVVAAKARYRNKRRWIDSSVMTGALLLYATPLFWLSLMGILLFSVVLGWLPAFGMETVGASLTGWARAADIAQHLILPTVTLGCFFMAVYVRLTRASMLEVIGMDFVKTARAKGVSPSRVIRVHVLRNALLPVITFAGIQLGQMAGGAVLTETVFAWPGIGRLMFDALLQRDYQLLLGIFLVTSIMVVVFNLLTDVLYRLIDPRIAAGAQQGAAA